MGISQYIKEIGRGKDGARSLTREQAADLLGQVLDGTVTDLEVGGFCLAMRIKGETPEEMAGFLDAAHARLQLLPPAGPTTVVLPSYNGARKLPVLTPLLALLLAREGVAVVLHGTATEDKRVSSQAVLAALGIGASGASPRVKAGDVVPLTLTFENADGKRLSVDIEAPVKPLHAMPAAAGQASGSGHSGHKH